MPYRVGKYQPLIQQPNQRRTRAHNYIALHIRLRTSGLRSSPSDYSRVALTITEGTFFPQTPSLISFGKETKRRPSGLFAGGSPTPPD